MLSKKRIAALRGLDGLSDRQVLVQAVRKLLDAYEELQAELHGVQVDLSLAQVDLKHKRDIIELMADGQELDEGLWTRMKWQCDKATEKSKRLQAVVDKLPKTADGVPVVSMMKIWSQSGYSDTARFIDENGESNRFHGWYSTEAAAKAGGEA